MVVPPWVRQAIRRIVVAGLLGLIGLGVLGQAVRDRSAVWAVLMYLPLPLIGVASIGFDLVCRGRGLQIPRLRFGLAVIGLSTVLGAVIPLIGWGTADAGFESPGPPDADGQALDVLHWNIIWGGGWPKKPERWASIRRTIAAQGADLIILSEAPSDDWLDELVTDLGPTGSRLQVQNVPKAAYWYKLAVCSKGPLRLVRRESVRNGVAMVVEAKVKGVAVRVLVVDGLSHPFLWRSPFLLDVARLCREAEEAGEPFDLVAGDFNSMARSVGFDALEAEGYALASRSGHSWRGTFPSFAPVYDIDHIWVRRDHQPGLAWRSFTNFASDHRGQVARLHFPDQ